MQFYQQRFSDQMLKDCGPPVKKCGLLQKSDSQPFKTMKRAKAVKNFRLFVQVLVQLKMTLEDRHYIYNSSHTSPSP